MVDTVLCGDAIEVMKSLPDESVSCIVTSPPYNIGLDYGICRDLIPHDEFVEFQESWLGEAYRVSEDTARMYVIVSENMLFWFRNSAEARGWRWGQLLSWCKPNPVQTRRISGDWNYMTEYILLFRKGKRTPMDSSGDSHTFNWFIVATPQSNFTEKREHPAQLPILLCKMLLARTPGGLVLDPFCGSGSVLIAARTLRKHWLGIDLNPDYCEMARRRIAEVPEALPFEPTKNVDPVSQETMLEEDE